MPSIRLKNVSLSYPIYDAEGRSLKRRLLEGLGVGGRLSMDKHGVAQIIALNNISLQFGEGDRVAILGLNGAGKSTLLRLIAGVYEPQSGEITVQGKVSSLFNIQSGIDKSATGYENIILCGLLFGLSRPQIESKIEEITEFSELGSFLDFPVRTYSQGMAMRLAFSISTSVNPEILLLDEWIGTGDQRFVAKAQARLQSLIGKSKLLVLASHRIKLVKSLCNKAVLLDKGEVTAAGKVGDIVKIYNQHADQTSTPELKVVKDHIHGKNSGHGRCG